MLRQTRIDPADVLVIGGAAALLVGAVAAWSWPGLLVVGGLAAVAVGLVLAARGSDGG